ATTWRRAPSRRAIAPQLRAEPKSPCATTSGGTSVGLPVTTRLSIGRSGGRIVGCAHAVFLASVTGLCDHRCIPRPAHGAPHAHAPPSAVVPPQLPRLGQRLRRAGAAAPVLGTRR